MGRPGPYLDEDKWWGGGLYSLNPGFETMGTPERWTNVPYPAILEFFIDETERKELKVACK
jgi:hypothetical protein